jgi:hypothetical protein
VTTSWSGCGGDACDLQALAEEENGKSGSWIAKFAGSNQTPWQFWNGTAWSTINTYSLSVNPLWQGPSGPFPGGIWSFSYSH